jgi:hypothetical protein
MYIGSKNPNSPPGRDLINEESSRGVGIDMPRGMSLDDVEGMKIWGWRKS